MEFGVKSDPMHEAGQDVTEGTLKLLHSEFTLTTKQMFSGIY